MNKTEEQDTSVSKYVQSESASSSIQLSLPLRSDFEIEESKPKEILFSIKYIMIGNTMRKTIKIPLTPHERLIIPMLEDTVLSASFIEEPTKGTKLLIANLAVFNETVSAPCAKTFFSEKINVKIDIMKTVTEVKAVLTAFDIPPNS